jgi:hypothetical protein
LLVEGDDERVAKIQAERDALERKSQAG